MSTQRNSSNVAEIDITKGSAVRRNQEELNPCYKEHLLSLNCIDSNYDRQKVCEIYFTNYRNCREFWAAIQHDRKLKGIQPHLPPLSERVKIKADYLSSK